jgi:dihydrofolate synthase/folylpolyglutamate synthase
VFDRPEVAVITPISLEHTAILGNTPAEIARDKAGIIKAGSTCVLAPQRDAAVVDVVRTRCEEVGAKLVLVQELYEAQVLEKYPFGQSFQLHGPNGTAELRTPLLGRHQVENAATAVAVIEALRERGHTIPDTAIAEGLARARVPGRMEVMGQKPLIIADGAHNAESAATLAEGLKDYFHWRKCFLVIGVTADKDLRGMGFQLARFQELIVCTRFRNPRSMDPYAMIQEIGFLGPAAVAEESAGDAIETALSYAGPDDLICITGSLYLVAEAREYVLGESVVRR